MQTKNGRDCFAVPSVFCYTMHPKLRSTNSQKVRLKALNRVVVTHTLPVSTPGW